MVANLQRKSIWTFTLDEEEYGDEALVSVMYPVEPNDGVEISLLENVIYLSKDDFESLRAFFNSVQFT